MLIPLLNFLFTSNELMVLVNLTATVGLVRTTTPPSIVLHGHI